jgi:MFS family permease
VLKEVVPALVATLTAQMLVSMSVGIGPVVAPLAAPDVGLSPELIGAYISVVYCSAAGIGLISGSFVARFGPIRMTQVSLVLIATGLCVGALATLAVMMIASAMVLGIGNGPTTPASSSVLARVTPPEWRNAVFSTKQMGVPLGNSLAGLVIPVVALTFGWRSAALAAAALCIALALAIEPWRRLDVGRDPGRRLLSAALITGPLSIIFRTPELRRLSLISFVYSGTQTCFTAFLVTYLHDRVALSLVSAGLVLTISQTTGAVGRLIWGTLTDRLLDPYWLLGGLGIGMSVCALLTAGFDASWSFWAIVAVGMAFGATTSAWNGVYLAQIAVRAPTGKVGEATGGSQFCTFGGVTMMPAAFSAALTTTGSYAIGFSALAVLTTLAGLWLIKAALQGKNALPVAE